MTKEEAKELIRQNEKLIDMLYVYFEKEKELAYHRGWNDCEQHLSCHKKEEKLQESKLFEA